MKKFLKRVLLYVLTFVIIDLGVSLLFYINSLTEFESAIALGVKMARPPFEMILSMVGGVWFVLGCETSFQLKKFFQK